MQNNQLPDEWEITDDPPIVWVRWHGEVLVFDIVDGLVQVDDYTHISIDEFTKRIDKMISKTKGE